MDVSKSDFDRVYFSQQIADPDRFDGVGNAGVHMDYIDAFLKLENIHHPDYVLDVGCGLGHMLEAVGKKWGNVYCEGIDSSQFAIQDATLTLKPFNCELKHMDLLKWVFELYSANSFGLGICMSVLQYLDDDAVHQVLNKLSNLTWLVYLTVPTDEEQRSMKTWGYVDPLAKSRTREQYIDLISPYFHFVGNRFLESKNQTCYYTIKERLFRF